MRPHDAAYLPGLRPASPRKFCGCRASRRYSNFYRAALFCRNLSILWESDVILSATLCILVDSPGWSQSLFISVGGGGLIVLVMAALLSINQLVR
jgi:hypothetical protein